MRSKIECAMDMKRRNSINMTIDSSANNSTSNSASCSINTPVNNSTSNPEEITQSILAENTRLKHELIDKEYLVEKLTQLAVLGEFASELTHEIKNPLAIISANAQIIVKSLTQKIQREDERNKNLERLESIINTTTRIDNIIKSVRNFSLHSNSDNKLFSLFDIHDLLEDALVLMNMKFKNENVTFRKKIPNHPLYISANKTQLSQVLINLLNNSVEALRENDKIERIKWISLEITETNFNVIFTITDNGPGVEKKNTKKIMTPFFTTKGSSGGTGLGLSLSQKIIKDHQGILYLNEKASDTQFVMVIPKDANCDNQNFNSHQLENQRQGKIQCQGQNCHTTDSMHPRMKEINHIGEKFN